MSGRKRNPDGTIIRYPSDSISYSNKRGSNSHSNRAPVRDILTFEIGDFPYVIGSKPLRVDPSVPDGTLWGEHSYYIPTERARYIPTNKLRHIEGWPKREPLVPDPVYDGAAIVDTSVWDTEVGWARRWLRTLGKREGRRGWELKYARSQRPYWYRPGVIADAVYVDIKAAYPSIYERASWNVEYERCKYLSIGGEQLTWPYSLSWKTGRSYIVAAAQRMTPQRYISGGRVHTRMVYNRNLNRPFWSFVMDVLASVAVFAIAAQGAIYYNCDGAIIPSEHLGSYIRLCSSVGITTSVKARGSAHVTESGFWRVGRKATRPYIATRGETSRHSFVRVEYDPIDMTLTEATWILNHFETLPAPKREYTTSVPHPYTQRPGA